MPPELVPVFVMVGKRKCLDFKMVLSYLHKAGSPIYCNAHSVKSISHIISCLKHLWIYICKSKERVCKMRSVGDPFPSLSIQATSFM